MVEPQVLRELQIALGRQPDDSDVGDSSACSEIPLDSFPNAICKAERRLATCARDEDVFASTSVLAARQPVLTPIRGPEQWPVKHRQVFRLRSV